MNIDIEKLSPEQRAELLAKLEAAESDAANKKRQDYEQLRADTVDGIMDKAEELAEMVKEFYEKVVSDTTGFHALMYEYGDLKTEDQMNYRIEHDGRRVEVKTNKVKTYDERANVAGDKLKEFMLKWVQNSEKGTDDPLYQIVMGIVTRTNKGKYDNKSLAILYDAETKFNNPEYTEIMNLFRQSNQVTGTATNFYFYKRDDLGVWHKVQVNFNKL